eukprot:5266548-Pleurochrysis_carterae.AAC.1
MQQALEAALFEPGPWQAHTTRPLPTRVPVSKEQRGDVLGTPLGLLFNELLHSPSSPAVPGVQRMLDMALDMDTGVPTGTSAAVIFFVVRLAIRFEAHMLFLLDHVQWAKERREAERAERAEA